MSKPFVYRVVHGASIVSDMENDTLYNCIITCYTIYVWTDGIVDKVFLYFYSHKLSKFIIYYI